MFCYITPPVIIASVYFKSSPTLNLALIVFRFIIHFENENVFLSVFSLVVEVWELYCLISFIHGFMKFIFTKIGNLIVTSR